MDLVGILRACGAVKSDFFIASCSFTLRASKFLEKHY